MRAADVLVVDDHEADRELLRALLEHAGHRIRTVVHGGDALQVARARPPDLVVADVVLPGMGGFELVALMRDDDQLAEVPLVLCSAYFTPADAAAAAMELGVAAVVPKPVEAAVLAAAVARALRRDERPAAGASTVAALRSLNAKLVDTIDHLDRLSAERGALIAALVAAQEEERRRIAVDVHDDSVQTMIALGLELRLVEPLIKDPTMRERCRHARATVEDTVDRLRALVAGLRSPDLEHGTVGEALADLAARSPVPATLDAPHRCSPPAPVAVTIYRIAQEALANAARHARASAVSVTLAEQDGGLRLVVTDDGLGMADVDAAPVYGHLGLTGMRERAVLAGGWFRVTSAPGAGTVVEAWLPL